MPDPLTLAEAGELFEEAFPPEFMRKQHRQTQVPWEHLVGEVTPLGPEHFAAAKAHIDSGAVLGVTRNDLTRIRQNHHRLAQYLVMPGMTHVRAAQMCNMNPASISSLLTTPAFQELLAHYARGMDEKFDVAVTAMADLAEDMVAKLREVLEETPEKLTPQIILESIKTLADRSGHAPVSRSIAISASVDMGDRIKRARERAAADLMDRR